MKLFDSLRVVRVTLVTAAIIATLVAISTIVKNRRQNGGVSGEVNWTFSANPEIRGALATWIKSALSTSEAPFFRAFGLSAQEIESLEALQLKGNIKWGRTTLTLRPKNESMRDVEARIQHLLSPTALKGLSSYWRKLVFVRPIVIGVAGDVYATDKPLSVMQADQMTQILAESSTQYAGSKPIFPNSLNWDVALNRLKRVLTADQLAALKYESVVLSGVAYGENPANPSWLGEGPIPPSSFFSIGKSPEGIALVDQKMRRTAILRAWFAREYGPFFRSSGILTGNIQKIEDYLDAQWLNVADEFDAATAQGSALSTQSAEAREAGAIDRFNEQAKESIGSSNYELFRQYERTASVRQIANTVAGMVFDSGEPLSAGQGAALTQIVATNSAKYQAGGTATFNELDMPNTLVQAEKVLTPKQLAALQTSLAARTAIRRLRTLLASAENQAQVTPRDLPHH